MSEHLVDRLYRMSTPQGPVLWFISKMGVTAAINPVSYPLKYEKRYPPILTSRRHCATVVFLMSSKKRRWQQMKKIQVGFNFDGEKVQKELADFRTNMVNLLEWNDIYISVQDTLQATIDQIINFKDPEDPDDLPIMSFGPYGTDQHLHLLHSSEGKTLDALFCCFSIYGDVYCAVQYTSVDEEEVIEDWNIYDDYDYTVLQDFTKQPVKIDVPKGDGHMYSDDVLDCMVVDDIGAVEKDELTYIYSQVDVILDMKLGVYLNSEGFEVVPFLYLEDTMIEGDLRMLEGKGFDSLKVP